MKCAKRAKLGASLKYPKITIMDTTTPPKKASLIIDGVEHELPIIEGTIGFPAIDMRQLLSKTGYLSFDPGFKSTASCQSAITDINGAAGELRHRGYNIVDLVQNCSYLQVCALLIKGELLSETDQESFEKEIYEHTMVLEDIRKLFAGMTRDSHPMAMMTTAIASLSSFYHRPDFDTHNREYQELTAIRLIAKMPTIAAMCYKHRMNQPFMYPDNERGYVSNFLHMMFGTPCGSTLYSGAAIDALEKMLIIHADHEQNASTSTVRTAGSSGADPYTCISSAIGCLWGPAHGGANEAVLKMLDEIGTADKVGEFIAQAKDPNNKFRLMGFGHRVYKNFDPRAKILKESCDKVLAELGVDDPLLEVAKILEDAALKDAYFIDRKLYPNVDFYSGIILKALGIPVEMFTVMFAVGRTVGWVSHWIEMVRQPGNTIARPQQVYIGPAPRDLPEDIPRSGSGLKKR